MKKGFTLLELIVVIVILGILATLGFSQYTKTVEKSRTAEPKMIIGSARKLAIAYYMENGTTSGISSDTMQLPTSCTSDYYFRYSAETYPPYWVGAVVYRCASGGKTPNATNSPYQILEWQYNFSTNQEVWCYPTCGWGNGESNPGW